MRAAASEGDESRPPPLPPPSQTEHPLAAGMPSKQGEGGGGESLSTLRYVVRSSIIIYRLTQEGPPPPTVDWEREREMRQQAGGGEGEANGRGREESERTIGNGAFAEVRQEEEGQMAGNLSMREKTEWRRPGEGGRERRKEGGEG